MNDKDCVCDNTEKFYLTLRLAETLERNIIVFNEAFSERIQHIEGSSIDNYYHICSSAILLLFNDLLSVSRHTSIQKQEAVRKFADKVLGIIGEGERKE